MTYESRWRDVQLDVGFGRVINIRKVPLRNVRKPGVIVTVEQELLCQEDLEEEEEL